ncbi:MAG: hypothetical protein ACTHJ7_08355 [Candidatus Nitrosocosmicus sp.]
MQFYYIIRTQNKIKDEKVVFGFKSNRKKRYKKQDDIFFKYLLNYINPKIFENPFFILSINIIFSFTFATILVFSITTVFLSVTLYISSTTLVLKAAAFIDENANPVKKMGAPLATSGDDNVYIVWWSNKTGNNNEVMFRASTDGGKTFGDKMNLSNTPNTDSSDANIAASGNKVFIT